MQKNSSSKSLLLWLKKKTESPIDRIKTKSKKRKKYYQKQTFDYNKPLILDEKEPTNLEVFKSGFCFCLTDIKKLTSVK